MSGKRFFLYANPGKPDTVSAVRTLSHTLLEKGYVPVLDGWLFDIIHTGERCDLKDAGPTLDALISIGGDGTLLRALPAAAENRIPVLGINMGHTGFLLETDPSDLRHIADRLIQGQYHIEERMMLRCVINDTYSTLVMNEVALTRGHNPSSLIVDIMTGDELVYSVHGDGVLVSTPSGTTGYALSAGGPVIHPALACHVIVPICTHIMHQRPVILPPDSEICLAVRENRGNMHQISIDGQIVLDLTTDTEVHLQRASETAQFIRFGQQRFLTRLRQKQTEWSNHVYGGNI